VFGTVSAGQVIAILAACAIAAALTGGLLAMRAGRRRVVRRRAALVPGTGVVRGGAVPVNGVPQTMPDGSAGGVPVARAPQFAGAEKLPIPQASTGAALTVAQHVKTLANLERLKNRPVIQVTAGNSALLEAQAGPDRVDPRTGRPIGRAAFRDGRPARSRGQFAQNRTVPASTQRDSLGRRANRATLGVSIPGAQTPPVIVSKVSLPSDTAVTDVAIVPLSTAKPADAGNGAFDVREAPATVVTTGVAQTWDVSQLAYLGAAAFVAYLVFQGRG